MPTYGYELAQAVKDGYLVDFNSVETTLKFIERGIVYDDLSDEARKWSLRHGSTSGRTASQLITWLEGGN